MLKKFTGIVCLLVLTGLHACVKDQIPTGNKTETDKKQIASFAMSDAPVKISVYSLYDSFFVGYNPVYFTITDTVNNSEIKNAAVMVNPVMDMMTMKHSCPVDQPFYSETDKAYKGAIAFIMATEGQMGWTIALNATVNGKQFETTLPVIVKSTGSDIKLITSVKDQNNVFHYVALVSPQKPDQKTGLNDLELAVYKRAGMMSFPPVDGLTLSFTPTMPSMGHGSANNIVPAGIGNGHYKGKVNFSMTGDWQLDFGLSGNGSSFTDHAILKVLF